MALSRSIATSGLISKLLHSCHLRPGVVPRPLCTTTDAALSSGPAANDCSGGGDSSDSSKYEEIVNLTKRAKQSIADIKKVVKDIRNPEIIDSICEEFYWHPFQEGGNELPYEVKTDENNWYARIDMPGIGVQGVRVWLKNNFLHFKGEESKAPDDGSRKYYSNFYIPPGEYQIDKVRAVLNNGVLKIVIPKVKLEEKTGFVDVEVEVKD